MQYIIKTNIKLTLLLISFFLSTLLISLVFTQMLPMYLQLTGLIALLLTTFGGFTLALSCKYLYDLLNKELNKWSAYLVIQFWQITKTL